MKNQLSLISFVFFFLISLCINNFCFAQNKGIVYSKEITFEVRALGNGYAGGVNIGTIRTYNKTKYYHFSLGELKHPREVKTRFQGQPGAQTLRSRSYVYGKKNNLFVLRAGIGNKRYLSERSPDKGVGIGYSYELGPTLGLLKPYYLEVFFNEGVFNQGTRSIKYNEENASSFQDVTRISGSSSVFKGIGEIKPKVGLHAAFAAHFDWGAYSERPKIVELGVMFDVFLQKIPIMIDGVNIDNEIVENRNLFINLFVNVQLGRRKF